MSYDIPSLVGFCFSFCFFVHVMHIISCHHVHCICIRVRLLQNGQRGKSSDARDEHVCKNEMHMMTWQNATCKQMTWQQRRITGRHLARRIRGVTSRLVRSGRGSCPHVPTGHARKREDAPTLVAKIVHYTPSLCRSRSICRSL